MLILPVMVVVQILDLLVTLQQKTPNVGKANPQVVIKTTKGEEVLKKRNHFPPILLTCWMKIWNVCNFIPDIPKAQTKSENNLYLVFSADPLLQSPKSPIGLKLSGVLARIVMLKFDRMYLEKLSNLNINIVLYQRYIDDLNMALSCLPPGLRLRNNKLALVPELVECDKSVSGDVRTARLIREIANSVMPSVIIMEEDTPSAHTNGRLPILDMEFWVEDNSILHQFYKKPMATRKVTMARSFYHH